MKRLLGLLAAVLMGASYASVATASPTFEYRFVVDSAHCVGLDDVPIPFDCGLGYHVDWLEQTRVVLSLDAVLNDRARYYLRADYWEVQSYENFGVVLVELGSGGSFGDPPRTCGDCVVDVAFAGIPESLSGNLRYVQSTDTVSTYMGGDGLWSGRLQADILSPTEIAYTGHWRLMRVVPEPGTLALLTLGLVGLTLSRRRNVSGKEIEHRRGCS